MKPKPDSLAAVTFPTHIAVLEIDTTMEQSHSLPRIMLLVYFEDDTAYKLLA